jgi:amino acid transporter
MLAWIPILITHIGFTRAVKVSQIPAELFPYREPLREWGSWAGLILLCILTIGKGFEVFIHGIDCKNFIVQYVGILVYLMCLFGYKIFYKTQRVRAAEVDLVTGVSTEPIESTRARQKAQWEEENSTKHPLIRVCRKVLAALL